MSTFSTKPGPISGRTVSPGPVGAANRRKGERRTKADRRDEIRFEIKSDRRAGKDRRKANNVWNGSH